MKNNKSFNPPLPVEAYSGDNNVGTTNPSNYSLAANVGTSNDLPTMSLSTGTFLEINAPLDYDFSGIAPALQEVAQVAQMQQPNSAGLGIALAKEAQSNGLNYNIHVDASPHISINLTNGTDNFVDTTLTAPNKDEE